MNTIILSIKQSKWNLLMYINFDLQNNDKNSKFKVIKLMVMLEYQNIKTFLQITTFQFGIKNFFKLKKFTVTWNCVIRDLNGGEIIMFYEK